MLQRRGDRHGKPPLRYPSVLSSQVRQAQTAHARAVLQVKRRLEDELPVGDGLFEFEADRLRLPGLAGDRDFGDWPCITLKRPFPLQPRIDVKEQPPDLPLPNLELKSGVQVDRLPPDFQP